MNENGLNPLKNSTKENIMKRTYRILALSLLLLPLATYSAGKAEPSRGRFPGRYWKRTQNNRLLGRSCWCAGKGSTLHRLARLSATTSKPPSPMYKAATKHPRGTRQQRRRSQMDSGWGQDRSTLTRRATKPTGRPVLIARRTTSRTFIILRRLRGRGRRG